MAFMWKAAAPASAQSFAEVGKQPPISILINASPWYNGFEAAVDLYTSRPATSSTST